jgi:DNA-binding GntR family transcriptional regulator
MSTLFKTLDADPPPRRHPWRVGFGEMKTLARTSLREQASSSLRASILGGELEAGQIYSAQALAERLGVSATPVREALLDLANAGLVEPLRNRGFRVLTVADGDLDEISEIRAMLEAPAMRLVVERAGEEGLATIAPIVDELEAAAEARDVARFLLADRDFHLTLLELTGNRRLVREVAQLRDQTRLIGLSGLAEEGKLSESAAEHRPLLDALQARDADRAETLMRQHIRHTRGVWAGRDEAAPTVSA